MKLTNVAIAVAAMCVFGQTAQARGYHYRYGYRHRASRHVLSQRYLERAGYPYDEGATYDQNWGQWPSGYPAQSRRRFYAERREHSGYQPWHEYSAYQPWHEDSAYSRRRTYLARRHHTGYAEHTAYRGGYGPRPAEWCGWEMRHLVGADPGPQYNLARNWAHWGHAGPAGVGAVVVWPHHVGRIVAQENGEWVIESGNDGHRLRTRPRSIAGAIAIRWG